MIAIPSRRAAGVGAAAATLLLAIAAGPASADVLPPATQAVDTTVRSACTSASPRPLTLTIDVRITGQAPLAATQGGALTFDRLTTRFTIAPDVGRPQVEGTNGSMNARLTDLALLADGAGPNPAPVVSPQAPLDLGTTAVKFASAPWFDAPVGAPAATFDPVGPWTVASDTGEVSIGLSPFALTLTSYPEVEDDGPPRVTSLTCKPESPWFAKLPVEPAAVPAPTITSLAPSTAAGGQIVTINGTDLAGATQVTFGGNPTTFKQVSATQLTAVVPTLNWIVAPPPTLPWDVAVTTPAGTSANTAADDFTYLTSTPAGPAITAVAPTAVPWWGGRVRVTGRGFKGTTSVVVGRFAARFTVVSDGSLTVTAPPQLWFGTYALKIKTPLGTATGKLIYR